jgi:hypothetical protein
MVGSLGCVCSFAARANHDSDHDSFPAGAAVDTGERLPPSVQRPALDFYITPGDGNRAGVQKGSLEGGYRHRGGRNCRRMSQLPRTLAGGVQYGGHAREPGTTTSTQTLAVNLKLRPPIPTPGVRNPLSSGRLLSKKMASRQSLSAGERRSIDVGSPPHMQMTQRMVKVHVRNNVIMPVTLVRGPPRR